MAFQLSPGVDVREIDLSLIIPSVSTTRAGFAGLFQWGPVGQRVTVTSINDLTERFQGPDNDNFSFWFTAANYLGYSNNLACVRVVRDDCKNASVATSGAAGTDQTLIKNDEDYETKESGLTDAFYARYPGDLGNSIQVSVSDRTDVVLNPVFSNPSSSGFTANSTNLSTRTQDTTFFHLSTQSAVANNDRLRFKRGTPQTISGFTAAKELGVIGNAGISLGVDAAAGVTVGFTAGSQKISVGDYLTTLKGGVQGFAKITGVTQTATSVGSTAIAKLAIDGFGLAETTISDKSEVVSLVGQVTTGATFIDANGITAANVLWKYSSEFDEKLPATSSFVSAHGNTGDLVHAIVVDEDGDWTGTKGTVLERFPSLSKATNSLALNGTSLFYKEFINANSKYVWWGGHPSNRTSGAAWGTNSTSTAGITYSQLSTNFYGSLTGGSAAAPTNGDYYTDGYELFADAETVDVSIILGGPQEGIQAKKLIDLVTARKDSVVFLSPAQSAVLNSTGNASKSAAIASANVVAYRDGVNGSDSGGDIDYSSNNVNTSSSYAVLDSGWKYMYDRFNDVFRFVPLNGDIAGIAVRSDNETETWFSPAGFNRGQVRDVVKLAYNPVKSQRDDLYTAGINPVVSFPGEGTVLFGDKTMQSKPSAFDRINVRRLFIVLEKAIATAAKFQLFEQNDAFTRASFRQLLEPFLRDVQSRRGIIDFKVVCDESNNTGEVIDRNEFVADIFIKPTRSINFISLNFIATRTGVDFDEIGGSSA